MLFVTTYCKAENISNDQWPKEFDAKISDFSVERPQHYVDVTYGAKLFISSDTPEAVDIDCTMSAVPMPNLPKVHGIIAQSDADKNQILQFGSFVLNTPESTHSFSEMDFVISNNQQLTLENTANGAGCPNDVTSTKCSFRVSCWARPTIIPPHPTDH
jgi:hypothetical protein